VVISLKRLRLAGTYYEIGRKLGESVRGTIEYVAPKADVLRRAIDCEKEVGCHSPDLLEELKGFSEGIDVDYEWVMATHLVPQRILGCNIFFVRGECTNSGHPLFIRHMDWIEDDLQHSVMLEAKPVGRYKTIGFNFSNVGYYGGINEAALAAGTASVPFYDGKSGVGLRDNFATRWILDNFSTTEEAVQYLEAIPHAEAINFLVADARGVSARVECAPKGVSSLISQHSLNAVCNFFMLEGTQQFDKMPEDDRSRMYYKRINDWFEQYRGRITLSKVKEFCRDHERGICEHLDDPLGGTIWSWVAELGTGKICLASGYPCQNRYRRYQISS
jgi:predicted choloylglycine hydrolase